MYSQGQNTANSFLKVQNLNGSLGYDATTAFERRSSNPRASKKKSMLQGFQNANWELALQKRESLSNRSYKGKEVSVWVDLEHFKIYGPGIYLFFHFMKKVSILFLLLVLCSILPIVYNYLNGTALSNFTSSNNTYFAKTSIANFDSSTTTTDNSKNQKLFNAVPDLVICALILIFYFYWSYRSNTLSEDVRKQVKLKSYLTLELLEFAKGVNESEVTQFMGQFGTVTEVASVKNYSQTIKLSKKIYEAELKMRQLAMAEVSQKQISEQSVQIEELYRELSLYEDSEKDQILKFYVSFSTEDERLKALETIRPFQRRRMSCLQKQCPENCLLKGERVVMDSCHTQPGEIIWENQHITWKSRCVRAVLQNLFLLLLIVIGFLFVSFLNILTPSSSTTTSVDTSAYTTTTILSVSNATIVQSWCLKNVYTVVTTGNSSLTSLCSTYILAYYGKIGITVGIAVAVIVLKVLLKMLVIALAKFQRYKSTSEQSSDIIHNLFLTYLFTTVLITFLLQAYIFGVSFKNFISSFIFNSYLNTNLSSLNQYSDFSTTWYVQIGYQIFLTWAIMAIHPTLTMPLVNLLLQKITLCRAQGIKLQKKMQDAIEPARFEIEDHYANVSVIIFVSISLSGGMPLILLTGFLAICLRFVYFKFLFIRLSKVPQTFDESLDKKVTDYIVYALIVHFCLSIWMYGVSTVFSSSSTFLDSYVLIILSRQVTSSSLAFVQSITFILQRMLASWYYSAFFLSFLLIIVLKKLIYNGFIECFLADPKEVEKKKNQGIFVQFENGQKPEIKSERGICSSYKIENNPEYFQVLAIMRKRKKLKVRLSLAKN